MWTVDLDHICLGGDLCSVNALVITVTVVIVSKTIEDLSDTITDSCRAVYKRTQETLHSMHW